MKVFLGSQKSNLFFVRPVARDNLVHASDSEVIATLNASGLGGPFSVTMGISPKSDKVYAFERYSGAFNQRYANKSGYVYELNPESFVPSNHYFDRREVVSDQRVCTLNETCFPNLIQRMNTLVTFDSLELYDFPNRPDFIPKTDEDLIILAMKINKKFGKKSLISTLESSNTNLIPVVLDCIKSGKYRDLLVQ